MVVAFLVKYGLAFAEHIETLALPSLIVHLKIMFKYLRRRLWKGCGGGVKSAHAKFTSCRSSTMCTYDKRSRNTSRTRRSAAASNRTASLIAINPTWKANPAFVKRSLHHRVSSDCEFWANLLCYQSSDRCQCKAVSLTSSRTYQHIFPLLVILLSIMSSSMRKCA